MTLNEIKALMARISIHWPSWKGPTTQEQLALTLSEYEDLLGELDEASVRSVLRQYASTGAKFAPTVAELRSGALSQAARTRSANRAIEAPHGDYRPSAATRALIDAAAAVHAASLDKHKHAEGQCEVCSLHDHSDTRQAGHDSVLSYNQHGQPYWSEVAIPMWQLSCPMCGWPEMPMSAWTTTAIEWAKNHGTLPGSPT